MTRGEGVNRIKVRIRESCEQAGAERDKARGGGGGVWTVDMFHVTIVDTGRAFG